MEKKYFTLIILSVLCFLLSCGSGGTGGGGDFGGGDPDFIMEWGVAVDDLDNDGAVDMAVTSEDFDGESKHYVAIILNDMTFPGSFFLSDEFKFRLSKYDHLEYITIGDLNDDGYPDIVTKKENAIFILFQDPTLLGQFFAPLIITVGKITRSPVIGDLNEDGLNDIAIAGEKAHLSILFQDSANPGNFLPIVSLGISSSSVAIADLNGDFINDLAVTSGEKVRLLFQDSSAPGTFFTPVALEAGNNPTEVKIGDLDKDGNQDLVIGNWGPSDDYKKGSITVLLQDSANPGEFLPADNYKFSCRAGDISLGDLNDDGFLDIAAASWCRECKITILFQDISSIGTFLPDKKYSCNPRYQNPWTIAIGDMNNDNLNDLIISENGFVIRFQDPASPGKFLGRTKIYDPD